MSDPTPSSRALPRLYSEHHTWLRGWLRGQLGCSQQAADLAQDTFLQLLAAREPVDIREPRAYLSTVARRLVIDLWRRRDLERAYLEALAALPEDLAPSAEERALMFEALEQVDQALQRLKPRTRQVFLLNQLQELSYREIAARLGTTVITVRRDMRLAILACCAATG